VVVRQQIARPPAGDRVPVKQVFQDRRFGLGPRAFRAETAAPCNAGLGNCLARTSMARGSCRLPRVCITWAVFPGLHAGRVGWSARRIRVGTLFRSAQWR
jgi:hypothetical protein